MANKSFSSATLPWYYYDKERGSTINLTRRLGLNWRRLADANDHPWLVFVLWTPRRSIGHYAGLIKYRYFSLPLAWGWWRKGIDYEAIAVAHGWRHGGDNGGFIFHQPTWGTWKAAASWSGDPKHEPDGEHDRPACYDSWHECCEAEDLVQ